MSIDIFLAQLAHSLICLFVVTASMSECSCHCGGSSVTPEPVIERRDSPPHAKDATSPSPVNTESQGRKATVFDCGLSVESEPEMELAC